MISKVNKKKASKETFLNFNFGINIHPRSINNRRK